MKYTKLNHRFAIIEFPTTLNEMREMSLDLPKSERAFYEFAFNSLEKEMSKEEEILFFDVADSKLTKTGFIVVGSHKLYLVSMKGGLTGGAETEAINYQNITEVDFDITPVQSSAMNSGVIFLKGTRQKRTLRNVSEANVSKIVSLIRSKAQTKSPTLTNSASPSEAKKRKYRCENEKINSRKTSGHLVS